MPSVAISVIIPTWKRPQQLMLTLRHILACDPQPQEVLIHVDAGDRETPALLDRDFGNRVTWFQSATTQGPGGGRNLLMERAQCPLIACFDDDSWPEMPDYFEIAERLFAENPRAAVLTGSVILRGMPAPAPAGQLAEVNGFENCACLIRHEAFLGTRKFLPLRYAYGMEETDLALQLLDAGWSIVRASTLQVRHDTGLEHHGDPQVNAAHITNTALLAFLRYPPSYWPLALAQVLNRVLFSVRLRRYRGIVRGLAAIAPTCLRYGQAREPVQASTVARSRRLGALETLRI